MNEAPLEVDIVPGEPFGFADAGPSFGQEHERLAMWGLGGPKNGLDLLAGPARLGRSLWLLDFEVLEGILVDHLPLQSEVDQLPDGDGVVMDRFWLGRGTVVAAFRSLGTELVHEHHVHLRNPVLPRRSANSNSNLKQCSYLPMVLSARLSDRSWLT
jgi:hypothetical protein